MPSVRAHIHPRRRLTPLSTALAVRRGRPLLARTRWSTSPRKPRCGSTPGAPATVSGVPAPSRPDRPARGRPPALPPARPGGLVLSFAHPSARDASANRTPARGSFKPANDLVWPQRASAVPCSLFACPPASVQRSSVRTARCKRPPTDRAELFFPLETRCLGSLPCCIPATAALPNARRWGGGGGRDVRRAVAAGVLGGGPRARAVSVFLASASGAALPSSCPDTDGARSEWSGHRSSTRRGVEGAAAAAWVRRAAFPLGRRVACVARAAADRGGRGRGGGAACRGQVDARSVRGEGKKRVGRPAECSASAWPQPRLAHTVRALAVAAAAATQAPASPPPRTAHSGPAKAGQRTQSTQRPSARPTPRVLFSVNVPMPRPAARRPLQPRKGQLVDEIPCTLRRMAREVPLASIHQYQYQHQMHTETERGRGVRGRRREPWKRTKCRQTKGMVGEQRAKKRVQRGSHRTRMQPRMHAAIAFLTCASSTDHPNPRPCCDAHADECTGPARAWMSLKTHDMVMP